MWKKPYVIVKYHDRIMKWVLLHPDKFSCDCFHQNIPYRNTDTRLSQRELGQEKLCKDVIT